MSKDTSLSFLRAILTIAGSYVLGHNLFGPSVDASAWQEIVGATLALGSAIWGATDKTASIEGIQSAVRSLVQIIGGLMVASGKLTGQSLNAILGMITALVPIIQSYTSRLKMKQVATGKLTPCADSGKADPAGPKIK